MCSKTLPINNKDKYISDLRNNYIINSELKQVAGNVAMGTGKLMRVLSFIIITGANIELHRNVVNEVDKAVEKETKDIKHDHINELEKIIYDIFIHVRRN